MKDVSSEKLPIEKNVHPSIEEYESRIIKQDQEIQRLKSLFLVEKTKCERYQKKLQYIQDNQDMFTKLKKAYVTSKLFEQQRERQTTGKNICIPSECCIENPEDLCAVNRNKLGEIKTIIRAMKEMVDSNQERLIQQAKHQHFRILDISKKLNNLYDENRQLKKQLERATREINEYKKLTGGDTKENLILRKLCVKLASSLLPATPSNESVDLSENESKLINCLVKKYDDKTQGGEQLINESTTKRRYESTAGIKYSKNYESKSNYASSGYKTDCTSSTDCKSNIDSDSESKTDIRYPQKNKINRPSASYESSVPFTESIQNHPLALKHRSAPNQKISPKYEPNPHNRSISTFNSHSTPERSNEIKHGSSTNESVELNAVFLSTPNCEPKTTSNSESEPSKINTPRSTRSDRSNSPNEFNSIQGSNTISSNNQSVQISSPSLSEFIQKNPPLNITNIIHEKNIVLLSNMSGDNIMIDKKDSNFDYKTVNKHNSSSESNADFESTTDLKHDFQNDMEILPTVKLSNEDDLSIELMNDSNDYHEYKSKSARCENPVEKNPLKKSHSSHEMTDEERNTTDYLKKEDNLSNKTRISTHRSGFLTARSNLSNPNVDSLDTFRSALDLIIDDLNCQ